MVSRVQAEWSLTMRTGRSRIEHHALEQDWSRGLWVVRTPVLSSYKNVDDFMSGRKIRTRSPDARVSKESRSATAAVRRIGRLIPRVYPTPADYGYFLQHGSQLCALKPITVVCPLYGYPLDAD